MDDAGSGRKMPFMDDARQPAGQGAAQAGEAALRAEICRVGRSLFERGYVHGTAGNVSVRLADGYLITPTDACLGFLDPERLAKCDAEGNSVAGDRPSKTLALHRRIYAADAAARCVIHTHSTHLVALTLAGVWQPDDIVPPLTPYYVMKVGHTPLIAYHRPGDGRVADRVAETIRRFAENGAPIRAVMLDRLGPNVWHESPTAAMAALEELEETARLWLMAGRAAAPLGQAEIDELRRAFGARW
jgi:ribulose-5-phosphate 4-epimerase/fuculose-1-phosphate aldolase